MEFTAKLRHLRIGPKKVRLVLDLIRGLDVVAARNILRFVNKRSAKPILKLLESAIANTQNNYAHLGVKPEEKNLYIKTVTADGGPSLKRWRSRAFGRAAPILKRSTHITLVLSERKPSKVKKVKKTKEDKLKAIPVKEEVKESQKTETKKPAIVKEAEKPKTRFGQLTRFIRRTGAK